MNSLMMKMGKQCEEMHYPGGRNETSLPPGQTYGTAGQKGCKMTKARKTLAPGDAEGEEGERMLGERIRCGNCDNNRADRLIRTSDNRFLYCTVCGSYTSLFDYSVYHEIDGIRGLSARLQNGNTLINLGKYREAETEFRGLTNEYSSNHATWFGLARAISQDFTSLDRWDETQKLLENAEKVAGQNGMPGGSQSAKAYYSKLRQCTDRLKKASAAVQECEIRYRCAQESPDAMKYQQKMIDRENCEKNLPWNPNYIGLVIFGMMVIAAVVCWNGANAVGKKVVSLVEQLFRQGYSNTEIEQYIAQHTNLAQLVRTYYTGRIVTVVGALILAPFSYRNVRNGIMRARNQETIRRLNQEISRLQPGVEAELRECEMSVEEAKRAFAQCENELERLKLAYKQERQAWC